MGPPENAIVGFFVVTAGDRRRRSRARCVLAHEFVTAAAERLHGSTPIPPPLLADAHCKCQPLPMALLIATEAMVLFDILRSWPSMVIGFYKRHREIHVLIDLIPSLARAKGLHEKGRLDAPVVRRAALLRLGSTVDCPLAPSWAQMKCMPNCEIVEAPKAFRIV